jgi:8-oxo-dGTP pyrophosphatase MutT (NUDIX family)
MSEFEVLAHGLYRPEQLQIIYQPDQILRFSVEQQAAMEHVWQIKLLQARQQARLLFDAPLYRLLASQQTNSQRIQLTLGDTSYKDYVTTREPAFIQDRPRTELSNPLAVCSVVETSDNIILLDQRQGVDVYNGRYHVIGGFFERGRDTNAQRLPDPFQAIQREIREETGIQASDISEQYCLGLVYDLITPHSELCFLTRLHIPFSEVLSRQPEDDEIKKLHTVSATSESLRQFLQAQHGNISATGEANLLLYEAWKKGFSKSPFI